MGTNTTGDVGIYKPADDEENWGSAVRASFDDIDTFITALKGMQFEEGTETGTDTTPSISGFSILKLTQSSATNITDFDDGVDGQLLIVYATNANSTLVHDGTNIDNSGDANITLAANTFVIYYLESTKWIEITRSPDLITFSNISGTISAGQYGSSSIAEADIAANAVAQGKLKLTATSVSIGAGSVQSLGGYATWFLPVTETDNAYGTPLHLYSRVMTLAPGDVELYNPSGSGVTVTGVIYRVSASPPHKLAGEDDWGTFVWLLRDKATLEVEGYQVSQDPPWDGPSIYPKDDPDRLRDHPHPWHSSGIPDGKEVVLVHIGDNDDVEYSEGKARADAFRARHSSKVRSLPAAAALLKRASDIESTSPEKIVTKRRNYYNLRAQVTGESYADLILTPEVLSANSESGMVSGVEEFDSVVRIVKV